MRLNSTARIKLIVTGDMEKSALHKSLQKVFPPVRYDEGLVEWDVPRKLNCATSYKLSPPSGDNLSSPMKELAKAMLAEAGIGRNGKPADLVVVIDDVELGNLGQESIVAAHFRAAVQVALSEYTGSALARYQDILREKCSFHLLKPMVESYLFGDDIALRLAGVPDGSNPKLVNPEDVEQFETNDPAWLPTCYLENAKKHQHAKPWWFHERHPKHYLEYLVGLGQVFYEEKQGKEALLELDWKKIPEHRANNPIIRADMPIIRSLFGDISDWFGIANPLPGKTNPAFYPDRKVNRAKLLLRNM